MSQSIIKLFLELGLNTIHDLLDDNGQLGKWNYIYKQQIRFRALRFFNLVWTDKLDTKGLENTSSRRPTCPEKP